MGKTDSLKIWIDTDDVWWACALAAGVESAKANPNNPPIRVGFSTNNPLLKPFVDYYGKPLPNFIKVSIPENELQMLELDRILSKKIQVEVNEVHGIITDELLDVQFAPISELSTALLLIQYGLISGGGMFYPEQVGFSKKRNIKAVCEKEEYAEFINRFLDEETEPYILDPNDEESVKALFTSTVECVAVGSHSPFLPILKSMYKGFDRIHEVYPVLQIVEDASKLEPRRFLEWSACLLIPYECDKKVLSEMGQAWRLRKQYDFDFIRYLKESRKSRG